MNWLVCLAAVAFLIAVALAVADVFWPLTVVIVLGAAALWWLERSDTVLALMRPDLIGAYVAIGFAWIFFKWTRVVDEAARQPRTIRRLPKWSEHSYEFSAYFFYWPIDVVAYVLSDLLREVWRFISAMVARSFDRYAEWRFKQSADAVDPHV